MQTTIMRVCSALSLCCLVSLLAAVDSQGVKAEHNLTFMLMTSFGQFGFNSSGLMPAADMALEDINSNPHVLPGYRLMYDTLRDSQVGLGSALVAVERSITCWASTIIMPFEIISSHYCVTKINLFYNKSSHGQSDHITVPIKNYFNNK